MQKLLQLLCMTSLLESCLSYELKKCDCGTHNVNGLSRIVNGEVTKPNEYPFYAALVDPQDTSEITCGGSIINENYILTAAHCRGKQGTGTFKVVLGGHDLKANEPNRQIFEVEEYIAHESWNFAAETGIDIMLLKLKTPIQFSTRQSPACFPPKCSTKLAYCKNATSIGHGRTSEGGPVSPILRHVTMLLESAKKCNARVGATVTNNMVCTIADGKDICQGDSGGPLVYKKDGRQIQIGVVSFGVEACGAPNSSGVYVKVESVIPWIQGKIGNVLCGDI